MCVSSIARVGLVAMLMLADPTQAAAQTPATPGPQSQGNVLPRVKPGTRIWVVTSDGSERSGTLQSLTPADLALVGDDGGRVVMPWSGVRRIDRKDPVLSGLVTGAVVGFAGTLGVLFFSDYFSRADEAEDITRAFGYAAMYAGFGAVAGALLDAKLGQRQVIYRSGSTTVSMAPLVAGRGAGLRFKVRW